jgi:hypothetical protein
MGCSVPVTSSPDPNPNPTFLYQTISAGLTATMESPIGPTLMATESMEVAPTREQTLTPFRSPTTARGTAVSSTATPSMPCNRASAGKPEIDITIPDGTLVSPGESFSKTWRLVNTGSCAWTRQYALVWFSGEQFGSTLVQSFNGNVPSGSSVDLTVDLVAPESPGFHQTNWKMRAPDGSLFGLGPAGNAPFWARIEVETSQEQILAPVLTITPTPIVVVEGSANLSPDNGLDLDSDITNNGAQDDLALLMHDDGSGFVMPVNGAYMTVFGTQLPSEVDCSTSTLSDEGIELKSISENTYICYRTNQGLPGVGRISAVEEGSILLNFTTWMVP